MVKIFPSNSVFKILSVAVLFAGSLSIANVDSVQAKELSYDEALRALQKTKEHSQAAQRWGEKRTLSVPAGQDPNQLIQKELLHVPGVVGIDGPTTPKNVNPIQVKVPLSKNSQPLAPTPVSTNPPPQAQNNNQQAGGWDWVSSNDTAGRNKSAPQAQAPVPTQNTQVSQPTAISTPMAKQTGFHEVGKSSMQTTYEAPVVEKPAPKKTVAKPAIQTTSDDLLGITSSNTSGNESAPQAAEQATSPVASEPRESAAELYNRAVKAHLSGKLSEAIADYSSALRKDPNLANAHCNLGQIYNQQHHFDMAIAEFRKALALNPKDEHSYNGIGASLRGKKDYEGAIKNWQMAVSIKPDLATAHYNLGAVYEVQNEPDKAIISYEKAVKNDYRLGEANYRIGLILSKKKRFDEAKEQFKQALKVSEKASYSADARKRLAWLEQKAQ